MFTFLFTQTPLKFFVQSFWRDEAFSYLVARLDFLNLLSVTAKDFNPPFYYVFLKIWMMLFGSSEVSMRSISLLAFFGILYVSYLFFDEVFKFSPKKKAVYLLLVLANPILMYYAFEARMYAMFAFLAALSWYAFCQRKIGLYQIATTLGLYTHYFMVFVVAGQFLFAAITERKKPHFLYLLRQMVVPVLLFIPWMMYVYFNKSSFNESFWIHAPEVKDAFFIPGFTYIGYERQMGFLEHPLTGYSVLFWISLLLLGLMLWCIWKLRTIHDKNYHRHLLFFGLWSLAPVIFVFFFSFYKPLFLPRYLIFAVPGFLLFLITILEKMQYKARVIVLLVLLILTARYHQIQLDNRVKANVAKTVHEIKSLAGKEDMIYVTNELNFFTAQYYFYPDRVYIYQKKYDELPSFVGKVLMPKDKFATSLPIYPKKAFILTDEDHYTIQSLY